MDRSENKENLVNPILHRISQDARDISIDSLDLEPVGDFGQGLQKFARNNNHDNVEENTGKDAEISPSTASSSTVDQSPGPALLATSSFAESPTGPLSTQNYQPEDQPQLDRHYPTLTSQPTQYQGQAAQPFAQDGDVASSGYAVGSENSPASAGISHFSLGPMISEAAEYADDLARELINDTNLIVRAEHSVIVKAAETEVEAATEAAVAEATRAAEAVTIKEDSESNFKQGNDSEDTNQDELREVDEPLPINKEGILNSSGIVEPSSGLQVSESQEEAARLGEEGKKNSSDQSAALVELDAMTKTTMALTTATQREGKEEDKEEEENDKETEREDISPSVERILEFEIDNEIDQQKEEIETKFQFKDKENIVTVSRNNSSEISDHDSSPSENNNFASEPDDSSRSNENQQELQFTSFQTALPGNSFLLRENQEDSNNCNKSEIATAMEFTKNYSDDLLMGQNDGAQQGEMPTGADLADFELPPYSGSSSGSEPIRQPSPVKQRKSSNSSAQASSSSQLGAGNVSPPDLTAVKNLIMSSYSRVAHVFHWKKPIETGVYFGIGVTLITALTFFSIISVVAYSALGLIAASGLIRIYKFVMSTLNKSTETPFDHVWDKVLSLNVAMSPGKMHELVDASHGNINASMVYFKQVLLVEDKFATLKFGLLLYLLTYIGSWFNGMTLITISYFALFSVPIIYERNKTKIDEYLNLATSQVSSVVSMVTQKVSSLAFGSTTSKKQN